MRRGSRKLTIRQKMGRFSSLIVLASLLLVTLVWIGLEYVEETEKLELNLKTQVIMLAQGVASPLVFSDQVAANEDLATLNADETLMGAALFDINGDHFAAYPQAGGIIDKLMADGLHHQENSVYYFHPVSVGDERVGTLAVRKSTIELRQELLERAGVGLLLFIIVSMAAQFFSRRFSTSIATPIQQLAQVMGEVRDSGDFTLRVDDFGEDEISEMARSFNAMLIEIESRESDLALYRNELEQMVEVRTGELEMTREKLEVQNMALTESLDAAKEASRAKSQFLANMSHEIRTPMNGIFGMAELLMESGLDEQQQRMAGTIKKSGDHLLQVINDILDFSKIEAGKMELCPEPGNLPEMLENIAEIYSGRAFSKGVELSCGLHENLPERIRIDSVRLTQVLGNLIGNAVKFTEQGEVVLQAQLEGSVADPLLNIEVRDTGVGIPADQLEIIFDSFSQADGSSTRKFGGTGLGLTICREMISLMGGELKVASRAGEGSRFYFSIPVEILQSAHSQRLGITPGQAFSKRVLVVDDRAVNRDIIKGYLTAWGIEHETVSNAESALTLLHSAFEQGQPFHVALLDMDMPGTDGVQLADRIVEQSCFSNLRLILLASGGQITTDQHACNDRIEYRLNKPLRRSELFNGLLKHKIPEHEKKIIDSYPSRRVLVAEDNAVNRLLGKKVLERFDLDVDVVVNGEQAIIAVKEHDYDLILMDCQMPVMDGFEATIGIREYEAGQAGLVHTPIIAMTANVMHEDRERCMTVGMDDFLPKPFTLQGMGEMLAKWLNQEAVAVKEITNSAFEHSEEIMHVDMQVLESIRDIDPDAGMELLVDVTDIYLQQTLPQSLQGIRDAAAEDDIAAVARSAHSLKSGSANVGAVEIARLCAQMELMTDQSQLELAHKQIIQVEAEAAIVAEKLPECVKKMERL